MFTLWPNVEEEDSVREEESQMFLLQEEGSVDVLRSVEAAWFSVSWIGA